MSGVPYTFGNATTTIALSNLDTNFATPVTIGNTTVGLGNTVTTLGNVTLSNPTISGGTLATLGNTAITGGGTITSIGNVTLANPILTGISNNITFASGTNGIIFNNSSASVNSTLNDYEEGTWTPTLLFGGGSTGITYSVQLGKYTKIGRTVICTGYLTISSVGSSTGLATVGGLPFTVYNNGANYSSSSTYYANMTLPALNYGIGFYPNINTTTATSYSCSNTSTNALSNTNYTNTTQVGPFQFVYFTS
jgi:hypothetical protein